MIKQQNPDAAVLGFRVHGSCSFINGAVNAASPRRREYEGASPTQG
jgi:hypothetical protein